MPPLKNGSVLIIDDDDELNTLLTEYLGQFGFKVSSATHPVQGLRALKSLTPDVVVLDVMLPELDGFALCRKIRENSHVPILMLTARGDVMDRILGLELGADDYLGKPFEPRELVARISAILRRAAAKPAADLLRLGELELNFASLTAALRGENLLLTTAEFALLELLVKARGRVLSREQMMEATRGVDGDSFDRSIDVLVSRLRHKLEDDPKEPRYIKTVWGRGYVFIGERDD
ncbi:MAG TPA: response regulator transcription factor [Polyangiaceae bacterium]|nr:response regulator transcription factor [Polyangiaceae bacterium]